MKIVQNFLQNENYKFTLINNEDNFKITQIQYNYRIKYFVKFINYKIQDGTVRYFKHKYSLT